MSRIDLQVPFNEKEEAKRLGARWDAGRKVWYVPADVDPELLQKWRHQPPTPNIRAPGYFLATTAHKCWRCAVLSPVFAIVLPAEHEEFYVGDDPADDHWQVSGMPVVLSYVEYLSESLAVPLRLRAPHYRVDFSKTTGRSQWMNHCEHCAAKLGDFSTVCEHGVGFSPRTTEQAAEIVLEEINERFATVCGGYTYIEWFADARHQMRLSPK